jgi:hypothetical protein
MQTLFLFSTLAVLTRLPTHKLICREGRDGKQDCPAYHRHFVDDRHAPHGESEAEECGKKDDLRARSAAVAYPADAFDLSPIVLGVFH